jgi:hypothetical protein
MTLEDKELEVSARAYTADESIKILKADLTAKGYVPVEVTIRNQGNESYAVSGASTAMSSAKPKEIAWKFTKKGIPRALGLKALSLIFWPFTIASTIDSIYSFKKHTSLVKVLKAKGFKEVDEIVLPYSLVKRIIYVPQEAFYATFSVSLENLDSKELVVVPVEVS